MKKLFLLTVILFFTVEGKNSNNDEYIFTEGTGEVSVKPDCIIIKAGVSTVHLNGNSALVKTNEITDSLLLLLHRSGVKENDIETYQSTFVREYRNRRDTSTYLGIKSEHILKVL